MMNVLAIRNISNITNSQDVHHTVSSLAEFGPWLYQQTPTHVQIVAQNGNFNVFDDTYKPAPIQLDFTDLIGQPSWIDVGVMQIKVMLRADIINGARILLPKGLKNIPGNVTTQARSAPSQMKDKLSFNGNFKVLQMRHIGNYKANEGAAWATIIN